MAHAITLEKDSQAEEHKKISLKAILNDLLKDKEAHNSNLARLRIEAKNAGFNVKEDPFEIDIPTTETPDTTRVSDLLRIRENYQLELFETRSLTRLEQILLALDRNERGDAELFLQTFPGKYVFDPAEGRGGEFYFWDGRHWQVDYDKQRYRDMEVVAKEYDWASEQITDKEIKKGLLARAKALRSAKRCSAVFVFVSSEVPFKEEWDHCPGLLPCANGIVNLSTGVLSPSRPDQWIRHICPTKYVPDASCPRFEQFLDEITLNKNDVRICLEDTLGSALTGIPKEERIIIFYGEDGRNGKGTLLQTLERTVGLYTRTFPSEMLLLQRNPPSSSSASPELANLQGVRFAIFSEINKGRKIDSSKVKNLSGRDTIPCRRLFSNRDIQITPSHTIFIQTNYKPEAPADDNALWTRNILIPFEAHFCDNPKPESNERKKDPELKQKLFEEREGILAWLVRACLAYQQHGLRIPASIIQATEDYRKENDGIQIFIEEKCVLDSALSTPCSTMQKAIKDFCRDQQINIPKEREISKRLRDLFGEPRKSNKGTFYQGIGIQPHGHESED